MPALADSFDREMDAIVELELSIVEHTQLREALEALGSLQARSGAKTVRGRKLKARGLLLTGNAGAGKSTIIEYWQELHPDQKTEDGMIMTVLVVNVPEHPTKRALVVEILGRMGYDVGSEINSTSIIEDIRVKVKLLGIKLIILDEAHHVFGSKDPVEVSEFLKNLLNVIGVGIVFAGSPELRDLRKSWQFDRRLAPDLDLRPYNWRNGIERLEYMGFLAAIEEQCIKLPRASNLADEDLARRLYTASRGEIGLVIKYVSQALLWAKRRDLPCIDADLLAEVDASWHPVSGASDELDFNEDLDLDPEADLEALIAEARKPKVDPERNPFACPKDFLPKLLAARLAEPEKFEKSNKRSGRYGRGTGPKEPKAFS